MVTASVLVVRVVPTVKVVAKLPLPVAERLAVLRKPESVSLVP